MSRASSIVRSRLVTKLRRSRLLTPTILAPAASTRGRFSRSYSSTSALHAQPLNLLEQRRQIALAENLRDQQHRVRPRQSRFDDLIPIENEILPQQRRRNRVPNRRQVRQMPLEERLIGRAR